MFRLFKSSRNMSCVIKRHASKRAVIFDMGGVITPSPLHLFKSFAKKHKLTADQMQLIFFEGAENSIWSRLECGNISVEQFSQELAQRSKVVTGKALPDDILPVMMRSEISRPYPEMISAIEAIRSSGLKVALLTNNFRSEVHGNLVSVDRKLFDVVVESCVEGINKPNPLIYNMTLDKLKVQPTESVYLDDIGANLKQAKEMGIHTIKVVDPHSALKDLGKVLSMDFKVVSGTIEVKGHHQIPVDNLKNYLMTQLNIGDESSSIEVRKFSHGQSNPTYYVKFADREMVLRKKPPGKLLPSAHAIEREYRVMKALGENGVPVPNLISLCEDPSIVGTPFYLMDYLRGRVFPKASPGLPVDETKTIFNSLREVLQKVHSVDVEKAGLSDYGKKGNYVGRQTAIWTKQYRASETERIENMERLIEWLPKNLPSNETTTVVHGDFRLDNCIFEENSSKVLAVLDWELSTLGDPISDLAYLCIPHYLPVNFPIISGFAGLDLPSLGIPTEQEIVEKYCKDMNIGSIEKWNVYKACAFFRIAAIIQGVYKRALDGQASSDQAKQSGKLVHVLSQMACTFMEQEEAQKTPQLFEQNDRQSFAFSVQGLSANAQRIYHEVKQFMQSEVLPVEKQLMTEQKGDKQWTVNPLMDPLKEKAKKAGLWNLFIPKQLDPEGRYGAGLTNLEYAFIAEEMGKVMVAPEIFNCSAPDTGNMEVLLKYGNKQQQDKWLTPLLNGEIRSCFGMTEPQVASSDATNIRSSIVRDGDEYVINGRKWWISGGSDPRCDICIFMGKTDPTAPKHQQQSMILVPMKTPGVTVVRPLSVLGYEDAPSGHSEILFKDVRVPVSNILLGEGKGFEIAQGRLGPGRIHHCMRLIGWSQRALELMIGRTQSRVAFGKPLIAQGTIQSDIAESRIEIEQARLLTLKAAHMMDTVGNKKAAAEIAMIKVVAPRTAQKILDRAMQSFGAAGLSAETPLAHMFAFARVLRLADGPDEVHKRSVARMEIKKANM